MLAVQPTSRTLSAMSALTDSQEPSHGKGSSAGDVAQSAIATTLAAAMPRPLEHPVPPADELPSRLVISDAPLPRVDTHPGVSKAPVDQARQPSAFFLSMYFTFGTLQTIDAYTTIRGLRYNGRELNPIVQAVQENPAGVIALKSAATFGTVFVTEKLKKRNKVVAALTVSAVNSAYLWVAAHNVRVNQELNEIARRADR